MTREERVDLLPPPLHRHLPLLPCVPPSPVLRGVQYVPRHYLPIPLLDAGIVPPRLPHASPSLDVRESPPSDTIGHEPLRWARAEAGVPSGGSQAAPSSTVVQAWRVTVRGAISSAAFLALSPWISRIFDINDIVAKILITSLSGVGRPPSPKRVSTVRVVLLGLPPFASFCSPADVQLPRPPFLSPAAPVHALWRDNSSALGTKIPVAPVEETNRARLGPVPLRSFGHGASISSQDPLTVLWRLWG